MRAETQTPVEIEEASERFYGAALARITRLIWVLGLLAAPFLWLKWGILFVLGWLAGSLLSFINFRSLTSSVNALGERIVSAQSRESGGRIVAKFLLRYALLAVVAYVIFKVSRESLYGLLAALFLPVAATLCEAGYETYVAFRRGL